jgi:hypothetical protein
MLTKALLFTILGACGVATGAVSSPDERESLPLGASPGEDAQPPPPPQKRETQWCCDSVNPSQKSGDGCGEILVTQVAGCSKVLHCSGDYTYDEGKVHCI